MKTVVYQLAESYGTYVGPPVIGPPDLDLTGYAARYRAENYTAAEANQDDYCLVSEEGFLEWLIAKGIVRPLPYQTLTVAIEKTGEHAYTPKHWPECPSCGRGRGEEEMGRVLHELNRAEWFRKCTECGHTWGHQDQPYMGDKPMLEDDGRYVEAGCVPYSISKVGGFPMEKVLEVCRERGWSEQHGMDDHEGISVARSFGLNVEFFRHLRHVEGRVTLRRVLDILPAGKNYIIATKRHWLPVVRGENCDPANTSLRSEVLNCWEVTEETQASVEAPA